MSRDAGHQSCETSCPEPTYPAGTSGPIPDRDASCRPWLRHGRCAFHNNPAGQPTAGRVQRSLVLLGVEQATAVSAQSLGSTPAGPIFNRSIPNGGDRFTVNVASSFRNWNDYDQLHAAQYRQIVDFADLRNSRWIVAPGQGGDPNRPHYDDLLERWQRVEYLPMQ